MCHVWTNLRSCSTEPLAYCDVNHRSDLSVESSIHLTRKWEVVADYIKVITHGTDKSNTCANIQNPAHEKWIKLSAVRGGDVHLKTATESSVNPPAHWASSRNRNIMMLAVVLGCNNQSLQGFSGRMLQPKMPDFMVWGVLLQRDCRQAGDTHAWKQCGK